MEDPDGDINSLSIDLLSDVKTNIFIQLTAYKCKKKTKTKENEISNLECLADVNIWKNSPQITNFNSSIFIHMLKNYVAWTYIVLIS